MHSDELYVKILSLFSLRCGINDLAQAITHEVSLGESFAVNQTTQNADRVGHLHVFAIFEASLQSFAEIAVPLV